MQMNKEVERDFNIGMEGTFLVVGPLIFFEGI
jgi:hypothetical protein